MKIGYFKNLSILIFLGGLVFCSYQMLHSEHKHFTPNALSEGLRDYKQEIKKNPYRTIKKKESY